MSVSTWGISLQQLPLCAFEQSQLVPYKPGFNYVNVLRSLQPGSQLQMGDFVVAPKQAMVPCSYMNNLASRVDDALSSVEELRQSFTQENAQLRKEVAHLTAQLQNKTAQLQNKTAQLQDDTAQLKDEMAQREAHHYLLSMFGDAISVLYLHVVEELQLRGHPDLRSWEDVAQTLSACYDTSMRCTDPAKVLQNEIYAICEVLGALQRPLTLVLQEKFGISRADWDRLKNVKGQHNREFHSRLSVCCICRELENLISRTGDPINNPAGSDSLPYVASLVLSGLRRAVLNLFLKLSTLVLAGGICGGV